jgi:hypothetical protein
MQPPSVPDDIRLLLESCRDEAELQHPEMASLRRWLAQSPEHQRIWDAVKKSDLQVRSGLHSVTVPPELAARISTSGDAMSADSNDLTAAFAMDDSSVSLLDPPNHRIETTRRDRTSFLRTSLGWVAAAGLLAASVLLYVNWPTSFAPTNYSVSARDLCQASLDWIALADEGPWYIKRQIDGEGDALVARRTRWKQIHTDAGTVDCYLSNLPDGRRIYQFEFDAHRRFRVADQFSENPDLPTDQFTCSARRRGDRIIVIAVEGGTGDYRQVVAEGLTVFVLYPPAEPMASAGARSLLLDSSVAVTRT